MLRKSLLWLHLVTGLLAAIVLTLLGLTGAVMVFETQLDHALNAKLYHVRPESTPLGMNALVAKIEQARSGAHVTGFGLPQENDIAMTAYLRGSDGKPLTVTVNPYTGEVLGTLAGANRFINQLHQFHKNLLLGPTGKLITGWGAGLLVMLALTGIVLWWPRKIWKLTDFQPGRRANFDLHNAVGFWSSLFMLLFGATGIVIHWDEETAQFIGRLTHTPSTLPIPTIKPAPGAKLANVEDLMLAAQNAAPGAQIVFIQNLGNPRAPVRVAMRFPEDHTPGGRTNLYLDPTTAAVLVAQTSRNAPAGYRLAKYWNRQLHTGDVLGWPSRIVACLASLALPLLALTGPLIWWGKFKRRNRPQEG